MVAPEVPVLVAAPPVLETEVPLLALDIPVLASELPVSAPELPVLVSDVPEEVPVFDAVLPVLALELRPPAVLPVVRDPPFDAVPAELEPESVAVSLFDEPALSVPQAERSVRAVAPVRAATSENGRECIIRCDLFENLCFPPIASRRSNRSTKVRRPDSRVSLETSARRVRRASGAWPEERYGAQVYTYAAPTLMSELP
jgi:hypothetical protein